MKTESSILVAVMMQAGTKVSGFSDVQLHHVDASHWCLLCLSPEDSSDEDTAAVRDADVLSEVNLTASAFYQDTLGLTH